MRQVTWLAGFEPENAAIHATNTVTVAASPETVWRRIVDAEHWPVYYPHASDVEIVGDEKLLGPGSRFTWKSMGGKDIVSWITTYEPFERIGWMAELKDDPDATAYHQWTFMPIAAGCHVSSDETQKGAFFEEIARTRPDDLHAIHQIWVEELRRVSEADETATD